RKQGILIAWRQPAYSLDGVGRFPTMEQHRLCWGCSPAIVEEELPLREAPQGRRAPLAAVGRSHHHPIVEALAHIMEQEIRVQRHDAIAQRGHGTVPSSHCGGMAY